MAYTAQRALALKLLAKFGKVVTLVRADNGGTYNPVTGVTAGGASLNVAGVGVLLNYKANEIGNDVKSTDRKLLYQGDALAIGDTYEGGRVYDLGELDPDETGTILTTAQIRL